MASWRKPLLWLLSSIFLIWVIQAMLAVLPNAQTLQGRGKPADMAAYWTAGRLLLAHRNPYATATVARMEGLAASHRARALVMRNPPWALPLVAPLGVLPFRTAFLLWDALSLAMVLYSLARLAGVYGLAMPSLRGFLPLLFVPTYIFLLVAQTPWIVLLGFALFLAHVERRPAAAGAALFLVSVKFNICFLFWPVFLLWAVDTRQWRCLGALLATLAAAMIAVLAWDPLVIWQYGRSLAATRVATQQFFNLVGALRTLAGGAWPAFVVPGLGLIWALAYYRRHRQGWRWAEQAPLLILVSLALAPYSFLFDEVIANVAVLAVAASLRGRRRIAQWAALGVFLAAELLLLLLMTRPNHASAWIAAWMPFTWLALYLIALRAPAQPALVKSGAVVG